MESRSVRMLATAGFQILTGCHCLRDGTRPFAGGRILTLRPDTLDTSMGLAQRKARDER